MAEENQTDDLQNLGTASEEDVQQALDAQPTTVKQDDKFLDVDRVSLSRGFRTRMVTRPSLMIKVETLVLT